MTMLMANAVLMILQTGLCHVTAASTSSLATLRRAMTGDDRF